MVCYKDEVERRINKLSKEQFGKVKATKAHKDKICSTMKEDEMRDNILNG